MTVVIEPVGNQTELFNVGNQTGLTAVGNGVALALFDVFTNRYFMSQFQIGEQNEGVRHALND